MACVLCVPKSGVLRAGSTHARGMLKRGCRVSRQAVLVASRRQVFHVWHDNPDAATCNAFCGTLSKMCEEAWDNRPMSPSIQSMAGEIAALNKLHATGVLTDAEFARAKARIIDQGELKKIGFV